MEASRGAFRGDPGPLGAEATGHECVTTQTSRPVLGDRGDAGGQEFDADVE